MTPRTNKVTSRTHVQATPAPLLATSKGQYANLPSPLSTQATPSHTTPLLQHTLLDWYILNPNKKQLSATLFPLLSNLPHGSATLSSLTARTDAIHFLAARPAGTCHFLTDTPGKSTSISAVTSHSKVTISPEELAKLHHVLQTDFVTSPCDAPPLHCPPSERALARRAERTTKQLQSFQSATPRPTGVLASIQGGCSPLQRGLHAARTASGDEEVMGYSIDGLYAGESSEMRTKCIRAAIKALPDAGIRVLSGGDGSPDEVLGAVAAGIDIIEGDYPFRRARDGLASDLRGGKLVNVRDRNWLLWKGALVEGCGCFVCVGGVSRAYLRHLFEVHEMLGVSLVCAHNLWDYFEWFQDVREAVGTGKFELFVRDFEQCRDKGTNVDNMGLIYSSQATPSQLSLCSKPSPATPSPPPPPPSPSFPPPPPRRAHRAIRRRRTRAQMRMRRASGDARVLVGESIQIPWSQLGLWADCEVIAVSNSHNLHRVRYRDGFTEWISLKSFRVLRDARVKSGHETVFIQGACTTSSAEER